MQQHHVAKYSRHDNYRYSFDLHIQMKDNRNSAIKNEITNSIPIPNNFTDLIYPSFIIVVVEF